MVISASATAVSCSQPRTRRRRFMIRAKVRSTTQRRADRHEANNAARALDDLGGDVGPQLRPVDQTPGVAAVGEDRLDQGEGAAREAQDALGAVAVLDVGGMDLDGQQAAVGVGQDVALASVDAFSRVVAFESPF